MSFFQQFKLIDALFLVLFIQALYTAVRYGLHIELIKDCAVFSAAFISFQYYPVLLKKFEIEVFKQEFVYFLSFWVLLTSVLFVFFILRKILQLLIRREEFSSGERWAAVLFSLARFVLLASVLVFGAHLLPFTDGLVRGSAVRRMFKNVAPAVYSGSFTVYKRLRTEAEKNKEVIEYYEAQDTLRRSNKKRN